jgi:hypothetical protein
MLLIDSTKGHYEFVGNGRVNVVPTSKSYWMNVQKLSRKWRLNLLQSVC